MNECCDDWVIGIAEINAPITLQTIRSGGTYKYLGAPFRFCPWCGVERRLATGTAPKPEQV